MRSTTDDASYLGFEEEYLKLFVRAERVASRILTSEAEAEDIAAETMVRALSSWLVVRSYSLPWVTKVATNLALDAVRRHRPDTRESLTIRVEDDVVSRADLVPALKVLPRRQQQALVLRYVIGFDERETAEVMGVSRGTVKTHLRRGLETLRRTFNVAISEVTIVPN